MEGIPGDSLRPMAHNPEAFKPDMETSPHEFVRPDRHHHHHSHHLLYIDVNNRSIFPTDS